MMLRYHWIAFFAGFVIDLVLGDPEWIYHPVRMIGALISGLEKGMNRGNGRVIKGFIMVLIVVLLTAVCVFLLLVGAYSIHVVFGCFLEAILTWQALAMRNLRDEAYNVHLALKEKTLIDARSAVGRIVGRDTKELTEEGVIKAAVETVAENTSDGITAPMLALALFGPVGGYIYKAVNTMDSMVGYKNERYADFGKCAAKLDDILNFIPSRLTAIFMCFACLLCGTEYDMKSAWRIWKRDRRNHKSPNSAQTEAACAGALGIKLGGSNYYFGELVEKPTIGDEVRPVERDDIIRSVRLMYKTSQVFLLFCLLIGCMEVGLLP